MSFLKNIFSPARQSELLSPDLLVDMHSHVLPMLDDGSESFEDSLTLLREFQQMGYKKLIATPHIMGDFFKNTPETILPRLEELKQAAKAAGIDLQLEAAAEYYLDEWFIQRLEKNEKLLTFGNNYLLFELSYINEPSFVNETIFTLKTQGYRPVLAHPERYLYWHGNTKVLKEIHEKGVVLQVNINSLTGYYNKGAQRMAEELINLGIVEMLGSDCHGMRHIETQKRARQTSHYKKALKTNINNTLLG
ncbi:MAG TPA: CpsB/CapC family capsule biosynthesis tyrosine phosphatase [Cytophagaceae bacterium]|jgi:tyrosine-protein phosphatase YwqE|nr:CpsB/CapC family capsule biosynthesis tyrosine phosphatase [Cytophagaceae bacterium]